MTAAKGKEDNERSALDVEHELPGSDEGVMEVSIEPSKDEFENILTERDSLRERVARQQAEFENYRKRLAKEQQDFREYALESTIRNLLPILDSFDNALKAPHGAEFRSGVELINKQLHDALAKMGVEPIAAMGQQFDPNYHQAIQMVETSEAEHDAVVDELQKGYKLKDRLLRPAMVRVAQNPKK